MDHGSDVHTSADYSCYIHVHNKTSVDITLDNSKVVEGKWAKESPPNTIEAGSKRLIELNDEPGPDGSKGSVVYEIYPPKGKNHPVKLYLEFSDPCSLFNDNYLRGSSSKPNLVSVNVLDYATKGHPFTGHVEIYLTGDGDNGFESQSDVCDKEPLKANFNIGFETIGGLFHRQPVHEDIAIAALIRSNLRFPKGTTYNNLDAKQWEYTRGLVWPDDPSCLLFKDLIDSNSSFENGAAFLAEFYSGSPNSMTQRSHFGDLQVLHGMATKVDEHPNETKENLLAWLKIMYKLAIGEEGVSENDQLYQRLPTSFSASSSPSSNQTLRDLLLGKTATYRKTDISKRALGVCMHMISDSYAVGHTLRRLKNPYDLDSRDDDGFIRFKPGTHAQLGSLITFHTYRGQSGHHDHYDDSEDTRSPRDLESFNHIIGARDAIEKCKTLIDFFAAKTRWDDGVYDFLANDVFALDAKVTRSNIQVDERFGLPETSGVVVVEEDDYQVGLERKMALLEGGLAYAPQGSEWASTGRSLCANALVALKWCTVVAVSLLAFVVFQHFFHL